MKMDGLKNKPAVTNLTAGHSWKQFEEKLLKILYKVLR